MARRIQEAPSKEWSMRTAGHVEILAQARIGAMAIHVGVPITSWADALGNQHSEAADATTIFERRCATKN